MKKQRTDRIRELDALRGIAALLVLVFHLTIWRTPAPVGFEAGSTGVHLFFIISGFVIFMTTKRSNTVRSFTFSRLTRLYPAYWVVVTITFVARMLADKAATGNAFAEVNPNQYLANMTMFQNYLSYDNIDGQYWTLLVEMLFYMLVVVAIATNSLTYAHVAGTVISIAASVAANAGVNALYEWVPLLKFVPLFIAGIIFYKIYAGEGKQPVLYVLLLMNLLASLLLYRTDWYIYISRMQYSMMILLFFACFLLFVNGKMGFLVNPVTLFLGKISYSLYLVHNFIFASFLVTYLTEQLHINTWVACFGIALPLAIAGGAAVTFGAEIPLTKHLRKAIRGKSTAEQRAS